MLGDRLSHHPAIAQAIAEKGAKEFFAQGDEILGGA